MSRRKRRTIWRHVRMSPYGSKRPFYSSKGVRIRKVYFTFGKNKTHKYLKRYQRKGYRMQIKLAIKRGYYE